MPIVYGAVSVEMTLANANGQTVNIRPVLIQVKDYAHGVCSTQWRQALIYDDELTEFQAFKKFGDIPRCAKRAGYRMDYLHDGMVIIYKLIRHRSHICERSIAKRKLVNPVQWGKPDVYGNYHRFPGPVQNFGVQI
jgi:hypothetical protein